MSVSPPPSRLPPPTRRLSRAELKAALAAHDALAAAHADALFAAAADEAKRQQALNPPGGWWRRRYSGGRCGDLVLRYAAVAGAAAAGCLRSEIASASGAAAGQVSNCLVHIRRRPECVRREQREPDGPGARDWPSLLADAVERELCAVDVARAARVSQTTVRRQARRHGVRLRRGKGGPKPRGQP